MPHKYTRVTKETKLLILYQIIPYYGTGTDKHLVNVLHVSQVCYEIPTEETSMASFSYKCHQLKICPKKSPFPAKTPPLRESGADASTASSSSMVYVVGLPALAFPAFGPQVDWPNTHIGPTGAYMRHPAGPKDPTSRWHSIMSLCGKNHRVARFTVFESGPLPRCQAGLKLRQKYGYMRKREHLQKWIRNATKVYKSHKGNTHIISY